MTIFELRRNKETLDQLKRKPYTMHYMILRMFNFSALSSDTIQRQET
jgi:hypothetical protein